MCMAILCIFSGEWFTKQAYDDLRKEVDWEHNQPIREIFHAVKFEKSGDIHVTDMWKLEEYFKYIVDSKLKPIADQ